jgi:hypothetical protein
MFKYKVCFIIKIYEYLNKRIFIEMLAERKIYVNRW